MKRTFALVAIMLGLATTIAWQRVELLRLRSVEASYASVCRDYRNTISMVRRELETQPWTARHPADWFAYLTREPMLDACVPGWEIVRPSLRNTGLCYLDEKSYDCLARVARRLEALASTQ